MRPSIQSFNILPLANSSGIWTFHYWFVQISAPFHGAKFYWNAPNGEISIYDFLLIDLVLKPRTCRPFSWPFAHISKPFALKTSIFKDLTLVFHWKYSTLPVQLPYPSQVSLKFLTPCAQATVKCLWVAWRGGMLKPRIDRRFNIYIFLIIKMIFE